MARRPDDRADPTDRKSTPHFGQSLASLRLDLRSLAVVRISLGGLLLGDILLRWTHAQAHYGERGVLPRTSLLAGVWDPSWFSLATTLPGSFGLHLMFALLTLIALALLVGWQTRWSSFLAWLGVLSLHNRNPLILDLGDDYFRLALFWGLILPWGAACSLDAYQRRPDRSMLTVSLGEDGLTGRVAGLVLLWQIAAMAGSVFSAALAAPAESEPLPWQSVLQASPWKALATPLALWGVAGVLLLGCPFWNGKARTLAALGYAAFNFVLSLSGSGLLFPLLGCLPLAFLGPWWWQRQALNRLPVLAVGAPFSSWRSGVQVLLIPALLVWAGLTYSGAPPTRPAWLLSLGRLLRIDPPVARFPLVQGDGRVQLVGQRRNGEPVEIPPGAESTLALNDQRWRNYLASLWEEREPYSLWAYGHCLCQRWSPSGQGGPFEISEVRVMLHSPGMSEQRPLLEHACLARFKATTRPDPPRESVAAPGQGRPSPASDSVGPR